MLKIFVFFIGISLAIPIISQWKVEADLQNTYGPGILFRHINVLDSQTVWLCGRYFATDSSFVAVRTEYNGWKRIPFPIISPASIVCITGKDSVTAWLGANNGKVYHTTNGGINWTIQINDSGNFAYVNSIKFSAIHPNYGYVFCDPPNGQGTPFHIYKTINGGLNWEQFSPSFGSTLAGYVHSMSVTDSSHVWLGLANTTAGSRVAFTTNAGTTWVVGNVSTNSNYTISISFKSDNILGFTSTDIVTNNLYRSTNSGLTWQIEISNTSSMVTILNVEPTSVWYYATIANIFKSSNDGGNWANMNAPIGSASVEYLDAKRYGAKIYGWAICSNGFVLSLNDSVSTIGITPISNNNPKAIQIYQNYPNPFNPTTKIKFDIPQNQYIRIKIYDALGKEVTTLVEQKLAQGTYETDFDGSKLASGVYFYTIESSRDRNDKPVILQTRKMILVK